MAVPLVPLLIGAGASLAQAAPALMTDPMEKRNRQRLAELQAREEAGTLGLTPEEQQAYITQRASILSQVQGEQTRQLQRALGGAVGMGAGDIAAQSMAQRSAAGQEALRTQAELAKLQMEAQQRDLQELEDRTVSAAQRKMARRKALGDIVAGVATGALGAMDTSRLTGPEK